MHSPHRALALSALLIPCTVCAPGGRGLGYLIWQVLRKSSSLTPTTRSKEELALEYRQALIDYREGAFTMEDPAELTPEGDEVWDTAGHFLPLTS